MDRFHSGITDKTLLPVNTSFFRHRDRHRVRLLQHFHIIAVIRWRRRFAVSFHFAALLLRVRYCFIVSQSTLREDCSFGSQRNSNLTSTDRSRRRCHIHPNHFAATSIGEAAWQTPLVNFKSELGKVFIEGILPIRMLYDPSSTTRS